MRCFVEVNHSPFSRILCRCTSCRNDVVTMAAKPRRRRREERDGERKSRRKQIQNQIQRRRKKEEREGKKGRGEEDGERPRRNADVCFHARPDALISSPLSPRGYWSLCLWICIMPEHQTLRISPTHPLFDLPTQTAITTCDDATKTWQLDGSADGTSSTTSSRLFPVQKNKLSSPSHKWVKLGGHASLFSDWIVCWHFTQCELCQGCMCVSDFSILFRLVPLCCVCHPSPDVRCNWFECVSPFFYISACCIDINVWVFLRAPVCS